MEISRWKSLKVDTRRPPLLTLFSLFSFVCLEVIMVCEIGVYFALTVACTLISYLGVKSIDRLEFDTECKAGREERVKRIY